MSSISLRFGQLKLGGYQSLRVWQAAVDLATECYVVTAAFPASERFGLSSQMRSAAVSVVSNIAEGHGRGTNRSFAHFLSIANGSLKELEAQVVLTSRLGLASIDRVNHLLALCDATGQMLHGLVRSLRSSGDAVGGRRAPGDAVVGETADAIR